MSMDCSVVSSKFQIVIPRLVRERLGVERGQTVVFMPSGNEARLVIVPRIESLAGGFPELRKAGATRRELWKDDLR